MTFFRGMKQSIEDILNKAWKGAERLNPDGEELNKFKTQMGLKYGQEIFIHLFNLFRVNKLFIIKNETAM